MTTPLKNLIERLQRLDGPETCAELDYLFQDFARLSLRCARGLQFQKLAETIPTEVSGAETVEFRGGDDPGFRVPSGEPLLLEAILRCFGADQDSWRTFRRRGVLSQREWFPVCGAWEHCWDFFQVIKAHTQPGSYTVEEIRGAGKQMTAELEKAGIPVKP